MDANVLQKALVAIAIIILVWLDFRPRKRKINPDPTIAAADASERHAWRFIRWGTRILQILAGIYLLWTSIKYLIT
ncbi:MULTISPECIES: hypothetical protein [Pantoea]|jgi:hypothetical protein|uniref:hypothetical protein n=1 Tax=Pantoea TaxID=53335 RepID=UPI001F448AF6|nr:MULTISPECIES: hypothetical protein [Pantoea]UIL54589.1 hypothetical protein LZU96_20790 [Pantoea agglomerans]